jgi:hypothetical protein
MVGITMGKPSSGWIKILEAHTLDKKKSRMIM